ncbi:helix-turn-helix domain-containing protein [Carnobacterium pleistocenium]|uniref:helix-turn-helix domain-containing protein n=1 Tax=Carnobacterium pleistocenium TaxID=181073 RepID=UPI00068E4911|nr:helix-turn-helix domain-containing protein [Carnobacterium pleistocenium]
MKKESAADYDIKMENVRYSAPQRYYGTRILFVIKGSATISFGGRNYKMEESDLLVVNRTNNYSVIGSEDNCIISLSISSHFFVTHYKEYFQYDFGCFSEELDPGREGILAQLRHLVAEIMIADSRKEEGNTLEIRSNLYQIMLMMTRFFKKEARHWKGIDTSDERIERIIQLIEQRYEEPLTLSELAEYESLSSSYLSRYFKQMTGMGFLNYLNRVRIKHSLDDLLYTSDNLFQIAMKNGFSTAKNYTVVFKTVYQQTPAQYRKEHQHEQLEQHEALINKVEAKTVLDSPAILDRLASYLDVGVDQSYSIDEEHLEERRIILNSNEKEELKREKHIVFIGELKELLNENVKKQLILAKQQLRVDFVGIQKFFEEIVPVKESELTEISVSSPIYANSDIVLQFLKEQGIYLFLKLEYEQISQNEDYYIKKIDQFIQHALQVFGRDFVEKWQILFYSKEDATVTSTELERIYLKVWQVIKHKSEKMKVGTFFPFDEKHEQLPENQQWQITHANKIEFIGYETDQNEIINFNDINVEEFAKSHRYIRDKTKKIKLFLQQHQMERPMFLINWNILTGNTRYINGTFFRGALILKKVLELEGEIEGIGFWINNEIHERVQGCSNNLVDNLELFHFFNEKHPTFYTMRFKERLRGNVTARGTDYIMTENEDGYQLIIFNERQFSPRYSIDELFVKNRSKELHIYLTGIKPGNYQIRTLKFDRDNGGLYPKWWNLNSKYGIDHELMDHIVQSISPSLDIKDEYLNEEWSFYALLNTNAIHLIEFRRAID